MNRKKLLLIGGIALLVLAVIGGIIFASKGGLSKLVIFPKEKEKEVETPKKKEEKKEAKGAEAKPQKITTAKEIGQITRIYKKAGSDYLDIDYVQWFEGEEADREAQKDGMLGPGEEQMPNGYYVRNVNPKIRTFRISRDAKAFVSGYRFGGTESGEPHKVDLETLKQFVAQQNTGDLYWITLQDNVVVKIEQQYRP